MALKISNFRSHRKCEKCEKCRLLQDINKLYTAYSKCGWSVPPGGSTVWAFSAWVRVNLYPPLLKRLYWRGQRPWRFLPASTLRWWDIALIEGFIPRRLQRKWLLHPKLQISLSDKNDLDHSEPWNQIDCISSYNFWSSPAHWHVTRL
jgi:hypothetical protein